MATNDNANGFKAFGPPGTTSQYQSEAAFAKGDLLAYDDGASGKVETYAQGTHTVPIGVAAEAASAADESIAVYDDPAQVFVGQCSGTYSLALNGTAVDIEGTTGIHEINENATVAPTVRLLRQHLGALVEGSDTLGANSRVEFQLDAHWRSN